MEFYLLFVALLFLIPFPKKWKFVWQLRFVGLAMIALIGGVTILTRDQQTLSLAEGIALMLVSLFFFYLALRGNKPRKKADSSK